MDISVCIPMYNEAAVIEKTAATLSAYMEETFGAGNYEIIFSNDGSTDGCDRIVRELGLPGVRVVGYEKNQGKGCAVRTALLASRGDIAMFTDADLAYGTDVIRRMSEMFRENPEADLVLGSRNLSEDGYAEYTLLRRIASKIYIRVLCVAGGFRLSDSQCGCKGFRHDAIEKIFPRCEVNGFAFDFEAILWANKLGLKIAEMPVMIRYHGASKVRVIRDTFRMLRDLIRMRRRISRAEI